MSRAGGAGRAAPGRGGRRQHLGGDGSAGTSNRDQPDVKRRGGPCTRRGEAPRELWRLRRFSGREASPSATSRGGPSLLQCMHFVQFEHFARCGRKVKGPPPSKRRFLKAKPGALVLVVLTCFPSGREGGMERRGARRAGNARVHSACTSTRHGTGWRVRRAWSWSSQVRPGTQSRGRKGE